MSNPEAGWYRDPGNPAMLRYFDGGQWTEHYHDPQAPTAPPSGPAAAPQRSASLTGPGQLFTDAWKGVMAQAGQLVWLSAGTGVALGIWYLLFRAFLSWRIDDDGRFEGDLGDAFTTVVIGGIVFVFVAGLIYSIHPLVTSRLMQLHHRGHAATLGAAWAKSKQRLWAYYGMSTVQSIGIYTAAYLLFLILEQVSIYAFWLLLVPLGFVWVKLGFLPIAAVATSPGQSMVSASVHVSTGRFWPILGRMLMLSLPTLVVYFLGVILLATAVEGASLAVGVAIGVVSGIVALLSSVVMSSGLAKLYLDSGAPSDV